MDVTSLATLTLTLIIFLFNQSSSETTGPKHGKLVVCYLFAGAFKRVDVGLQPAVPYCTHMVYLFVGLDELTNEIYILEKDITLGGAEAAFKTLVDLKETAPKLKVLVCVGGWNESSSKFSKMAKHEQSRKIFTDSVVKFLNKYNLDGIEINWQFPGDRGGIENDKLNFVLLVKEMSEVLTPINKTVSVAVSCEKKKIKLGVDIVGLSRYAHHISVMTYEYHGFWNKEIGVNAPLRSVDEAGDIIETLNILEENGASNNKLLLGISNFAITNIIASGTTDPDDVIGQPAKGQQFTDDGFMPYRELCKFEVNTDWIKKWHQFTQTPYLVKGDKFISYDDTRSICEKVKIVLDRKMGGVMYYSLDRDDYRHCVPKEYPLLRAVNNALEGSGCSCQDGFYGFNCSTKCSCKTCDSVIGDCLYASLSEGGVNKTTIIVISAASIIILLIILVILICYKNIRRACQKPQPKGPFSKDAFYYHNERKRQRASEEYKGEEPYYDEIGYETIPEMDVQCNGNANYYIEE